MEYVTGRIKWIIYRGGGQAILKVKVTIGDPYSITNFNI